jgi:hypothetical protein
VKGGRHIRHLTGCIGLLTLTGVAGWGFGDVGAGASTSARQSSSTAAASEKAEIALAKTELLSSSAYPSGWKGYGSSTKITDLSFFAGFYKNDAALLATCLGIPTADIQANPAEVAGQRYNGKAALAASENIEVFASVASAAIDAEAAGNPKTPSCDKHLPGSTVGSSSVNGVTYDITSSKFVERSIGQFGGHAADVENIDHETVPKYHQSFTEYGDLVYIEKGRSEAVLYLSNENAPVSTSFIAGLAQAAAKKLRSS